jgi:hypothetical protein
MFGPGKGKIPLSAKGEHSWSTRMAVRAGSMIVAGEHLFLAGPPDVVDPKDPWASYEGRKGAKLAVYSRSDGEQVNIVDLPAVPVYDGMSAARNRLYIAFRDGSVRCLGGK